MLTDVQTPFLGTPLAPLKTGRSTTCVLGVCSQIAAAYRGYPPACPGQFLGPVGILTGLSQTPEQRPSCCGSGLRSQAKHLFRSYHVISYHISWHCTIRIHAYMLYTYPVISYYIIMRACRTHASSRRRLLGGPCTGWFCWTSRGLLQPVSLPGISAAKMFNGAVSKLPRLYDLLHGVTDGSRGPAAVSSSQLPCRDSPPQRCPGHPLTPTHTNKHHNNK